jgi:hypothetical protein
VERSHDTGDREDHRQRIETCAEEFRAGFPTEKGDIIRLLGPNMGLKQQVQVMSAGLHACAGREAHIWAREASADLGISLAEHRAKPVTKKMVEGADCILAMDFRNKA